MSTIKEYAWVFSLVGGVLTLIALLTPAASDFYSGYLVSGSFMVWMWGLVSLNFSDYEYDIYIHEVAFTDNIRILIPCIICSMIILACVIVIIASAINYRKVERGAEMWLFSAITIIISTIAWIIAIEAAYIFESMSFWLEVNPGFGVIGPFIGASLALAGFGVSKISAKEREPIQVPEKRYVPRVPRVEAQKTQVSEKLNFCPKCGYKIEQKEHRFCRNCGFAIRG